ncbi:MAG: tetratricopeptide repeat protein [SAR324 cluster bacterium]|nr:tetratricopeptide repeat protein [SAR324 cluster bacterium]
MSVAEEALEHLLQGNTVEARRLLATHADSTEEPCATTNAVLTTAVDDAGTMRIQEEKARHLNLLSQADGRERALLLYNLGCFALYQEDILTAKLRFGEAARLQPNHLPTLINLACAHELMADFDDAAAELERALMLDPASPLARLNRALLRNSMGETGEGIQALRILAAENEENPGIALHYCRALLSQPSAENGTEARELIERHPELMEHKELKECLAFACYRSGELEAAGQLFSELLAENESRLFPRMGLIKVLVAQDRFEEALPHLERYQEHAPSSEVDEVIAKVRGM